MRTKPWRHLLLLQAVSLLLLVSVGCGSSKPVNPQGAGGSSSSSSSSGGSSSGGSSGGSSNSGGSGSSSGGEEAQCGDYSQTRNAYFGDLHVHTANSFDAYLFGNHMNDPAVAYDFARGQRIRLNDNEDGPRYVQLRRPLNFTAVTDHSEYLGEVRICTDPNQSPVAYHDPICAQFRANQPNDTTGFVIWGEPLTRNHPTRFPFCAYGDCAGAAQSVWESSARITESRNSPCTFTTFNAYEYSPSTEGARLHRNIIFKGEGLPTRPVSYFEAPQPTQLFSQLDDVCKPGSGCEYLSIPHNSNLSHGKLLWADPEKFSDPNYVAGLKQIASVNPVLEMMQLKGNSECKLGLGTADEECEFEQIRYKPLCCDASNPVIQACVAKQPTLPGQESNCQEVCPNDRPKAFEHTPDNSKGCVASHDFVRGALLKGMAAQRQIGFNPLRFGLIASTDNHNSAPGDVDEAGDPGAPYGWEGGNGGQDDTPDERLGVVTNVGRITNPGGLAGIWAEQNTRDSLYAALKRGEVFATSGTRMHLRFFAGDYPADMCQRSDAAMKALAYDKGVPMGGDIPLPAQGSPQFVIQAAADEQPLQRTQIVKLWVDEQGAGHEKVFDLATYAPPASVNDQCEVAYKAPPEQRMSACHEWQDPEWNSKQTASYYGRVFEDASCRWSGYMCADLQKSGKLDCSATPDNACCASSSNPVKKVIQERAWTSPLWYTPKQGLP